MPHRIDRLLPLLVLLIPLLACSGGDVPSPTGSTDQASGGVASSEAATGGSEGEAGAVAGGGEGLGASVDAGGAEPAPEIEEGGRGEAGVSDTAQAVEEVKETVATGGARAADAAGEAAQEVADQASSAVRKGVEVVNDTVQGALGTAETVGAEVASAPTRVAAGKEGLEYVGAQKCKMCHKVQHASWSASAHAELDPPLDCESCHGPGSEYRSLKIMKDPEAAKKAGLVSPTAEFCTGACHQEGFEETMLAEAHEHKEK